MAVDHSPPRCAVAQACCAAGADPNAKDGSGASAFATAKKKRNTAVLAVLEAVLAAPKPVTAEQMEQVRALPWFAGWRRCVIQAIDNPNPNPHPNPHPNPNPTPTPTPTPNPNPDR